MKAQAYQFCQDYILERLERIKTSINEVHTALHYETKSSAGDKHETGRAMLQLEREKLGNQLFEAEKIKEVLSKVAIEKKHTAIGLGSLIKTEKEYYFIAISAGVLELDACKIFCISPKTPIAKMILGKEVGHLFVINGMKKRVVSLF